MEKAEKELVVEKRKVFDLKLLDINSNQVQNYLTRPPKDKRRQ